MKNVIRVFSLLFVVISSTCLNGQVNIYKPFPEGFAVWKLSCYCNVGPFLPSYSTFQKFQVSGDTMFNSIVYKKVNCTNTITGNPSQPLGPSSFCFGYRNDSLNKKVFIILANATPTETLWYDFNLSIGDTLKDTYSFTNQANISNGRRIVSSIDSVVFCGIYYKRFKFGCPGGFATSLIQGIGFEDKFTKTDFPICPFEPINIYTTIFSTCDPTAIEEFNERKNSLRLYPNPVNSALKITGDFLIRNYIIYNNVGDIVEKEGKYKNEDIDVSTLSNGLYILRIEDERGTSYYSKFIKE